MRAKSITLAAIVLVAITGCSTVKTDPDQTALHYDAGTWSATKYKNVVGASQYKRYGPGDKYFLYPVGQHSYDATGGPQSEHLPFTSSSKDSVELATPLSVTFELVTNDSATLRNFHELIGLKYQAYYEQDSSGDTKPPQDIKDPSGVSAGWHHMLDFYMGQSIDNTVDRVLAGYAWRDAYGSADARNAIQAAVLNELPRAVATKMQGTYFTSWAVQVQRPVPTNPALLKAIADNQTQIAAAQAAKAKADADTATANAQLALQRAEAAKKKADISAYGSVEEYNKAQAIEKGINPYQPTYVVSGTAPSK